MIAAKTEQAGAAGTAPDLKVVKAGSLTTPASNADHREQTIREQVRPSLRAAIDAHCRDCGACDAGTNWREHVSCCAAISCQLWPVRPLSRSAPPWIASRKPEDLPRGWRRLAFEDALSELRKAPPSSPHDTERLSRGEMPARRGPKEPKCSGAPTCGPVAILNGGAL